MLSWTLKVVKFYSFTDADAWILSQSSSKVLTSVGHGNAEETLQVAILFLSGQMMSLSILFVDRQQVEQL